MDRFFKIWAQTGSNLRKFWKNQVILLKIDPIGVWKGHFFLKNLFLYKGLLSNSMEARPYQNQTWVPPRRPHSNCIKMINWTGFYLALLQSPQLGQYEVTDWSVHLPKGGGLGAKHPKVPGRGRCKVIQSLGWDNSLLKSLISSVH